MSNTGNAALDKAVHTLPSLYKGPGGVVTVVKDGVVVVRHAWGHADVRKRIPMSSTTLMPICSITKEFTCAVLLDAIGDPSTLDGGLAEYLPHFKGALPSTADLCNNQSGLRDYWALTVVCGAEPEGDFRPKDARNLLGRMQTSHFAPGTHYSYANGNFRILSDLIESRTGRPLGELISERVFVPAKMATAQFCTETSAFPGGAVGYEGNPDFGFLPADNRIHWTGDAGICASLDDMIAWESFIDATRDDQDGLYQRISRPPTFVGGAAAKYGFGLAHMEIGGVKMTGHGGAIRGYRSQRFCAASERLSVVVMFNHQADAHTAARTIMEAALGVEKQSSPEHIVDPLWDGHYLDATTNLTLSLKNSDSGQLTARFATTPEVVQLGADGVIRSESMELRRDGDGIRMMRPAENLNASLVRLSGEAKKDIAGRYHFAELDADFVCTSAGGEMYGAFEGFLGRGSMQSLQPIASDVWLLECQRAMDAPAPGDWTLHFHRDGNDVITGVTIGCWLARNLYFEKA